LQLSIFSTVSAQSRLSRAEHSLSRAGIISFTSMDIPRRLDQGAFPYQSGAATPLDQ
jgi:hypothetical protein